MVVIFFVLSGYVLSMKGLRPNPKFVLLWAACKRWFRLVLPICLSLLVSYMLFRLHLFHTDEVTALNGSVWFQRKNAMSGLPKNYDPHFKSFLLEGLTGALLLGEHRFSSNLWTMKVEFLGSMLVFYLATFLVPQKRM